MLFSKFRTTQYNSKGQRRGIASRLLAANARDVTLDAIYKVIGVTLSYAAPALMRQILEAIGKAAEEDGHNERAPGEWTPRSRAFVFALIALLLTLVRYIAELLNFHHARQVGLRVRSVMVAELFEKALKRRYVAGEVALSAKDDDKAETPGLREKAARAFRRADRQKAEATPRIDGAGTNDAAAEEADKETAAPQSSEPMTSSADVGKVVNMMSSDVNVLLRLGCDLHQLYGAPAEVLISGIFLTRLLGWSALAGFSLLVLATPINYIQGKFSVHASRDWKTKTDKRMGLVTELLSAARFIKLQGVAAQWRERVLDARTAEISALLRVLFTELGFTIIFAALPIGVSLLSFFCYVKVQGKELTVPVAFTAVTLFSMVRAPLNAIPAFAMAGLNAMVSIKRLEAFLEEEEVDDFVSPLSGLSSPNLDTLTPTQVSVDAFEHSSSSDSFLEVIGGSFAWSKPAPTPGEASPTKGTLRDITVSFPPKCLSVIAGPTGSGKSTLLHAILGELRQTRGSLILPKWVGEDGRSGLSYAAQSPWIEGGKSIKKNILFNSPYCEQRYKSVLFACALLDDLRLFDDGDETRVSSTTLSGGQQARIGLARALYAPSHTVLLDDPLAAVDAHVQRHVIVHALNGPLGRGRRILLVTHHVGAVLKLAGYLVYLKDGRVSLQGKVEQLRAQGLLVGPLEERDIDLNAEENVASSSRDPSVTSSTARDENNKKDVDPDPSVTSTPVSQKPARLLYDLEKRREGSVKWSFYSIYIGASSPLMWTLIIVLSVALRLVASGEQYWLKVWGEASGASGKRTGVIGRLPPAEGHENFYLGTYGLIGISIVVLGVVKSIIFWLATLRASQKLYVRLLSAVLAARLRFFDTNPLGRIMQRFNQDVSVMDRELPSSSVNFLNNSMALTGYLIICAVIVPPVLIPAAIFFAWGPSYVRGFLACTRDMQRIESTSTSPLYTVFASSMAAVTTIRAFGAERFRLDEMLTILDVTQAQWWAICTIEVWLSFRSQILGGFAVFLVSTLALTGAVSAGSAGMVMTSAQLLTVLSYYLCNDWKHLSNNLNSIERIAEYFELPSERSSGSDGQGKQPPAAWPSSSGSIHLDELCLTYDDTLPDVLHNITIDIDPTQHTAIVGRTGSGKTTMASALLRALEARSGKIIIDGIDISTLDVETLRRRISLVSQSPILFSGTVRSNLDPFDEHTDEECLFALRRVRVAAYRTAAEQVLRQSDGEDVGEGLLSGGASTPPVMTLSLDAPVAAGGANFSAGESQLLSLARALLRDARVVILDEATSSTDSETDAAIQTAIREMRDSIVITVAHRLQTVLDYDKVLVLSQGRVLEYGPPAELFAKADGEFRKMCEASGIREVQ